MEVSNYVNAVNPTINRAPATYAVLNDPPPPRPIIIFHSLVSPPRVPANPNESNEFRVSFPKNRIVSNTSGQAAIGQSDFIFLLLRNFSSDKRRKVDGGEGKGGGRGGRRDIGR